MWTKALAVDWSTQRFLKAAPHIQADMVPHQWAARACWSAHAKLHNTPIFFVAPKCLIAAKSAGRWLHWNSKVLLSDLLRYCWARLPQAKAPATVLSWSTTVWTLATARHYS